MNYFTPGGICSTIVPTCPVTTYRQTLATQSTLVVCTTCLINRIV